MPPKTVKRAQKSPSEPTTMDELKKMLWGAADRLRGSMDASQYKDVVLGLIFLKYISDAYEERRETIREELIAEGHDDEGIAELIDEESEYHGANVFVVPPTARWSYLAENAKGLAATGEQSSKNIGLLVDDAISLIMEKNTALRGTMQRIYNRDNVDQRRLGDVVDLFNSAYFTRREGHQARDLLGEVYEYFLEAFSRAEGRRGGEYFTPPSIVRTIVSALEPTQGRVYDPCCGSGGMFVQSEKFLESHNRDKQAIAIYGQESNERTWRMARMNLAVHGYNGNLGSIYQDTFARDVHPDTPMDFVMANPPFNIKVWARSEGDPRWRFGVPPAKNANYAWIQHILAKLAPGGSAGVVMANGSMASNTGGEGDIRAAIVEADLVSCMVALPTQLFRGTGIPACLWFFAKNKGKRAGEVLFIDARELGHLVSRAERDFSDDDVAKIAGTYRAWLGESAVGEVGEYADVPGFCASVPLAGIKAAGYALPPGRYVGSPEAEEDDEPIDEKIARLRTELLAAFDESARLEQVVRKQLERVDG